MNQGREQQENPFDNQRFREEFERTLDSKLTPLADLVAAHEIHIQQSKGQSKGLMWAVNGIWAVIVLGCEYLFHSSRR
jgi:hypothetical protein